MTSPPARPAGAAPVTPKPGLRVALEVWSSDFTRLSATCQLAEDLGFDGFYYGESPTDLNLECWTTLAALARSTSRIRLGPVIANILPTFRSTILLARQAAAVDTISGGRLDFRTGVGAAVRYARPWWQPHGVDYPDYDQRLADTRAALDALPELWGSGTTDPSPIPITMAARAERAMALAASHAQVWETSFCTPNEFLDQAATMAGLLDGREVQRSLEIDGFLGRTDAELARLLDRVRAERGGQEDLGPVLDRALVGTPVAVAEHLAALVEVGVDQVVVALHEPDQPEALEALAEAIG